MASSEPVDMKLSSVSVCGTSAAIKVMPLMLSKTYSLISDTFPVAGSVCVTVVS
jgi:hypothetical protein